MSCTFTPKGLGGGAGCVPAVCREGSWESAARPRACPYLSRTMR